MDAQAMEQELRRLALLDDGRDIAVSEVLPDASVEEFRYCLVGTFFTEKAYNFNAMRSQLANLWKSKEGVTIEDKGDDLIYSDSITNEIYDWLWTVDSGYSIKIYWCCTN
ncbi:hypothetical protein LINGRAHAP2_LOCUS20050 [Linum grandiflorum]